MANHFVPPSCGGEKCGMCYREGKNNPPTHKVGEEFLNFPTQEEVIAKLKHPDHDDPYCFTARHNLTQYVCCEHFAAIMGPLASQWCKLEEA